VLQLVKAQTLGAGEASGDAMLPVRGDTLNAVVGYLDFQAAGGFTDPAEGVHASSHGGVIL